MHDPYQFWGTSTGAHTNRNTYKQGHIQTGAHTNRGRYKQGHIQTGADTNRGTYTGADTNRGTYTGADAKNGLPAALDLMFSVRASRDGWPAKKEAALSEATVAASTYTCAHAPCCHF